MKKYIPDSYSAHAEGMSTVKANITVDQDKITDLQLEMPGESKDFGQAAMKELRGQILDAQSTEIDGVSGATLTTNAVKAAVDEALEKAMGKAHELNLQLTDGKTHNGIDEEFVEFLMSRSGETFDKMTEQVLQWDHK
ncbi:FMN-binding protein [Lactobacillus pasteurii]|uniref:Polyferredoxin n=1 Tax=Lactobacillus pasteurii DSM 23907 = CRBIP 24.76 TaxID=1423790 RepID=I7LAT0_9LACO|nr:FMN-binding protein [Lactobacillus pasteurii]TDG77396.1 hypothetical protein C5L33_000839 [Lactobacillus pasteurii]CCI84941.1 Polyferredoxin [Lactobacillus pasteurii DSM 23907 = CRBIP 24.76]